MVRLKGKVGIYYWIGNKISIPQMVRLKAIQRICAIKNSGEISIPQMVRLKVSPHSRRTSRLLDFNSTNGAIKRLAE